MSLLGEVVTDFFAIPFEGLLRVGWLLKYILDFNYWLVSTFINAIATFLITIADISNYISTLVVNVLRQLATIIKEVHQLLCLLATSFCDGFWAVVDFGRFLSQSAVNAAKTLWEGISWILCGDGIVVFFNGYVFPCFVFVGRGVERVWEFMCQGMSQGFSTAAVIVARIFDIFCKTGSSCIHYLSCCVASICEVVGRISSQILQGISEFAQQLLDSLQVALKVANENVCSFFCAIPWTVYKSLLVASVVAMLVAVINHCRPAYIATVARKVKIIAGDVAVQYRRFRIWFHLNVTLCVLQPLLDPIPILGHYLRSEFDLLDNVAAGDSDAGSDTASVAFTELTIREAFEGNDDEGDIDLNSGMTDDTFSDMLDDAQSCNLYQKLKEERDRRLCAVCLLKEKRVVIKNCNHLCLCLTCAQRWQSGRMAACQNCPICREPVTELMPIFHA